MPRKAQGYNARLDESLGEKDRKNKKSKQSLKSRRKESKGMEKAIHRRSYASVESMDKARKKQKMSRLHSKDYSMNPRARNP